MNNCPKCGHHWKPFCPRCAADMPEASAAVPRSPTVMIAKEDIRSALTCFPKGLRLLAEIGTGGTYQVSPLDGTGPHIFGVPASALIPENAPAAPTNDPAIIPCPTCHQEHSAYEDCPAPAAEPCSSYLEDWAVCDDFGEPKGQCMRCGAKWYEHALDALPGVAGESAARIQADRGLTPTAPSVALDRLDPDLIQGALDAIRKHTKSLKREAGKLERANDYYGWVKAAKLRNEIKGMNQSLALVAGYFDSLQNTPTQPH